MLNDLIRRSRSCRRFQESRRLSRQDLLDLIELARLSPCHRNGQELRFCPLWQEEDCERVFPHLAFAAALGPAGRPEPGQRPAAYIFILGGSREPDFLWADAGIACQSMLLGAAERGWAGCIFGGLRRDKLRPLLGLDEKDPPLLLALGLGWPDEEFVLEEAASSASLKYWREGRSHHVPKLPLSQIVWEKGPAEK